MKAPFADWVISFTEHYGDDPSTVLAHSCSECGALVLKSWGLTHLDPDPWAVHVEWHETQR